MKIYSDNDIRNFLNKTNYDIRLSGNARWIDQKCTMDVICLVSDCIINYIDGNKDKEFTVKDIWYSEYSTNNVQSIFSKPNPTKKALNEYDKYFGQSIKLLNYSGILTSRKESRGYLYKVNELDLLEYISFRDRNCLNFLQLYIEKVLKDSNIYYLFEEFFKNPSKDNFKILKENFINFIINFTKINGKTECSRIFTKVLNPLSFKNTTYGTQKGKLSKDVIEYNSLLYNQKNFRDIAINKPKGVTRKDYNNTFERDNDNWFNYNVNKAKNWLRKYNNQFRNGKSEIYVENDFENATQIHHIFPINSYPSISAFLENLIALTPNQHFLKAHPNNNTSEISKNYQYVCIFCKIKTIKENLTTPTLPNIYSFDNLKTVLNVGLKTNRFEQIQDMDFYAISNLVDELYIT